MISTELTVRRGEDSSRSFSLRKREDVFPKFLGLGLPRIQGSGFIILRSEHRALLPHRPREEDPSGDQLDSSYDRVHQELGRIRVGCVIMAHQFVVTQLSRNPSPGG